MVVTIPFVWQCYAHVIGYAIAIVANSTPSNTTHWLRLLSIATKLPLSQCFSTLAEAVFPYMLDIYSDKWTTN